MNHSPDNLENSHTSIQNIINELKGILVQKSKSNCETQAETHEDTLEGPLDENYFTFLGTQPIDSVDERKYSSEKLDQFFKINERKQAVQLAENKLRFSRSLSDRTDQIRKRILERITDLWWQFNF